MHIYRAEIWHLTGNPFVQSDTFESWSDGGLAVDANGVIADVGPFSAMEQRFPVAKVHDLRPQLIIPAFVDTHLHMPQLDIIGAQSPDLLSWLEQHTFVHEARFDDEALAHRTADRLAVELVAHGVTTAMIFASSHRVSAEAMFMAAERHGIRAIVGKVSMDQNAPPALCQGVDEDRIDTEALIQAWHGKDDRLFYALTPRFAPACSVELMASLGRFKAEIPNLYVQTHACESLEEIRWVRDLFPSAAHYLQVYEQAGLLSDRTVIAHCNHLSPPEMQMMLKYRSAIAHCPGSNMFLGSGLCPVRRLGATGLRLSLGSDIGGGTGFSPWAGQDQAYKVSALLRENLSPEQCFYLATLGGAEALSLGHRIGNFTPGKDADFQVLDRRRSRLLSERFSLSALISLADDRLVSGVYSRGRGIHFMQYV